MRWNPIGQLQERLKPTLFGLPKLGNRHPVIGTAEGGTNRNHQDVNELVLLILTFAWICQVGKMAHEITLNLY